MRILFIGPKENATTWQRIEALKENGNQIEVIYDRIIGKKYSLTFKALRWGYRKLGWRLEENNENEKIIEMATIFKPEVIFITKGLTIKKSTILRVNKIVPECVVICYSLDDIMNPGNQSKIYKKALPFYDVHFTSKTYNIPELRLLGAKRVELTKNSYSPLIHKPIAVSDNDKKLYGADISFVGGYEKERGQTLLCLAESGLKIRIWGNNWDKFKKFHPNLIIEYRAAYGEEYAKVVCSSKILLGFLRKINRDTITTRSIEIPAFGAFLLAERTKDQTDLFEEGKEAEFFSSNEELIRKLKFFIQNDSLRKKIATAGYKKCMKLDLSYNTTMDNLINVCDSIKK